MKSTLHVKNFGPIKDAKLELSSVNVLIGPQASGKSTLAKLYTICKSPSLYCSFDGVKSSNNEGDSSVQKYATPDFQKFKESVAFYSMSGYISDSTNIVFESPTHNFQLRKENVTYQDNLNAEEIYSSFRQGDYDTFYKSISKLRQLSLSFNVKCAVEHYYMHNDFKEDLGINDVSEYLKLDDVSPLQNKNIEPKIVFDIANKYLLDVFKNNAIYIPAERTIVNLIKSASLNLQLNKVPIPQHLLSYAAKYESAVHTENQMDLSFISQGTKYSFENGEDRIYFSANNSINLSDSASGIQSVVPMLLPLQQAAKDKSSHFSFVIEEPETNLFPEAQYSTLKFIERGRKDDNGILNWGAIHTYTTHSPFILSGFNNMLYAHRIGSNMSKDIKSQVEEIIPMENWINPENFSAYQIKDGAAENIFDEELGLIDETVIDQVSDDILEDFKRIALIAVEKNG